MASEEDTHRDTETLTEQQAERMLAEMNDVIRAGEEMRKLRTEMIKLFVGFGWTQDRIAQLTDMSQPAVSKQVTKHKMGDPPPLTSLSLDQQDHPWLEGRLWALAEEISETLDGTARCTRYLNAIASGKKRFTPQNVDELRRLVEDDLIMHEAELPAAYRETYNEISRALDVPATIATTAPASVRRALARQIQRDRFRAR